MTLLIEIGLSNGASIPDDIFILDDPAEGVLDSSRLAVTGILADYSGREMDLSVEHQSSRSVGPVSEYGARTCSLVLLNDDGDLDPATLEAAGLTAPGSVLRIRKTVDGITYPVFYGYIDSLVPVHVYPDHATVQITATDGMSLLAIQNWQAAVSPVGAGELSSARVNRILTAAGWPLAQRSIGPGDSAMSSTVLEGSPADLLQNTARTELGEFYIQPDGVAFFRGRHATITDARSLTSQATFGTGSGEVMYVDRPGFSWDRGQLINQVRANRPGGTELAATDATSVARHGLRVSGPTEVELQTDAEVTDWTRYVLATDKEPESRFTSLTLEGVLVPSVTMPQALGRKFGDRITVVRRPPGGIVDSREVFIRSVSHAWSADRPLHWRTVWSLQPVNKRPFFILDSASNGVLDQSVLSY